MVTNTSILGLTKPTYAEDQDVTVLNSNFDLIDSEAGRTRANFAGTYSTSSAYAVGDYCIYQGKLYRCTTAISSGEAWNSAHWSQVSAGDELASANRAIANVNTTAVVTALTDIPVNTKGRIRLGASISPIGAELLVNYINVGSSTRQTIIVNSNTAGRTFVNSRTNDSTWTGWQELALKSDFVVEQKSSSSFNVGDGQTGNVSIAIAKTGYTPIGCVGITGTGSTGLAYSDWYISGTNLMIYYQNNLGQAKTGVVLKANMLYIKN